MKEVQETEWDECSVCDSEKKGDLRSTTKGTVTLAGQFVEFYGLEFSCIFKFSKSKSYCIICGEHDAIKNLHVAEAFYASKSKLNTEHVMKLTNNRRDIAVYIGDNAIVNRLMIGDLGANSSFYHKHCSTNL